MENVEERSIGSTVEIVKSNIIEENNAQVEETNVCHKSNGVESDLKLSDGKSEGSNNVSDINIVNTNTSDKLEINDCSSEKNNVECTLEPDGSTNEEIIAVIDTAIQNDTVVQQETEVIEVSEVLEITTENVEKVSSNDNHIEKSVLNEQVQFETEILIEKNDNDVNENLLTDNNEENDSTGNILNELGPNIELSEVLRSSDVLENNNSTARQEVFNKEELLDILEGNDEEQVVEKVVEITEINKLSEAQIALQQLSRLKRIKKSTKSYTSKSKKGDKKSTNIDMVKVEIQNNFENSQPTSEVKQVSEIENKKQPTENIVNVLVMDWQDDEPPENISNNIVVESNELLKDTEETRVIQDQFIGAEELIECVSVDSTINEDQTQKSNKSGDESVPRRLSRVIKKKVIFDPDNPDTFTKGKSTTKIKDVHMVKDQTPKKLKPDQQTAYRAKSKSPLPKLQWKKPSPKNSKQYKRLSEVDKLLMDEGAVNMIYQLTPEAPKGRKNMKTKAEFIKKLQSSTPESKEMKFRERKKECLKYEDGEAKRILSGKQRSSLSSSVKSPSVSEDFETHSADDSIIYRRHSSSSYSSSCMSPRRLSDVETGCAQNSHRSAHQLISADIKNDSKPISNLEIEEKGVLSEQKSSSEIINKDDCLSIKEKLNSKLSLALNKRKREASKYEKPVKQKKVLKMNENINLTDVDIDQFKFISVNIDQRLAVISVKKNHLKICVEVLKELEEALKYVDSRQDISITLLSQCETLCSSLDLSFLLEENKEIRATHAFNLAECVRSLLSCLSGHSKLVCSGVGGACAGVALALVALSDVALASECATFALGAAGAAVLPGAAVLTARCRALPQVLVNDLLIFGRRLSAPEALQGGLISRVLWPDRFDKQVYDITKDIAAQPPQTVLLKKKLLSLKNNSETELTFLSCLEIERNLLVEYWTSVEGQELLRAALDVA